MLGCDKRMVDLILDLMYLFERHKFNSVKLYTSSTHFYMQCGVAS